jgi:hypothetical protein
VKKRVRRKKVRNERRELMKTRAGKREFGRVSAAWSA